MKIRIMLVCLWFLTFLVPGHTFALSCAQVPSIEKAYEQFDAVVVASVDDVVRKKEYNEVQLTVINSFKGMEERKISVEENISWGSLWGPSERGAQYLYFLKKKDDKWENPLCSPTKKVAAASKELDYLKDKEIKLKEVEVSAGNASTHWSELAVVVCLLGAIGYGVMRFVRRAKGKNLK